MLKSVADLEKMRKKVQSSLATRQSAGGTRLVVAMGTCGIAAGAREVVAALLEELEQRNLHDITLAQSGCKGLCDREPTVTVQRADEAAVTYGDVTPETARRIVAEHLVGGKVVKELVVFTGEAKGAKA